MLPGPSKKKSWKRTNKNLHFTERRTKEVEKSRVYVQKRILLDGSLSRANEEKMWAADWGNLLHVNPQLLSLLFIQEVSFSFGDGARGSFNISLTFEFWRWIQEDQVSEQSLPWSISGSIQGSILGSTQGSRLDSVKDKRSLLCTFIITMICFADRCSGMSSECILVQVTQSLSTQQQLRAIEKVTNIKTDVKSVTGKSNTCM